MSLAGDAFSSVFDRGLDQRSQIPLKPAIAQKIFALSFICSIDFFAILRYNKGKDQEKATGLADTDAERIKRYLRYRKAKYGIKELAAVIKNTQ